MVVAGRGGPDVRPSSFYSDGLLAVTAVAAAEPSTMEPAAVPAAKAAAAEPAAPVATAEASAMKAAAAETARVSATDGGSAKRARGSTVADARSTVSSPIPTAAVGGPADEPRAVAARVRGPVAVPTVAGAVPVSAVVAVPSPGREMPIAVCLSASAVALVPAALIASRSPMPKFLRKLRA